MEDQDTQTSPERSDIPCRYLLAEEKLSEAEIRELGIEALITRLHRVADLECIGDDLCGCDEHGRCRSCEAAHTLNEIGIIVRQAAIDIG